MRLWKDSGLLRFARNDELKQLYATLSVVMPGLVPGINVSPQSRWRVDGRVKPGHDGVERGSPGRHWGAKLEAAPGEAGHPDPN
jgi:hypothetical protein